MSWMLSPASMNSKTFVLLFVLFYSLVSTPSTVSIHLNKARNGDWLWAKPARLERRKSTFASKWFEISNSDLTWDLRQSKKRWPWLHHQGWWEVALRTQNNSAQLSQQFLFAVFRWDTKITCKVRTGDKLKRVIWPAIQHSALRGSSDKHSAKAVLFSVYLYFQVVFWLLLPFCHETLAE